MAKINQIRLSEQPFFQETAGIDGLPKSFYYLGELPDTKIPSVAIVGSRKPTNYGKETTYNIAYQLARRGVAIISGLALGVDSIAHKAALEAGGKTVAVQANGLHRIYPAANQQLAKTIVESAGAIISEYDIGIEPMQYRFLERNRIVSAISDAVIVTEAAARSGTLSTVAHALTQGKDVYVVPGNITSPMSAGCNQLLGQGAIPIVSIEETVNLLATTSPDTQAVLPIGSNPIEQQIINALIKGYRDGEAIFNTVDDTTSAQFNTALTNLEIQGIIKSLGANQWSLR